MEFLNLQDNFIAYKAHKSKRKVPTIIFHHGLMSDMSGVKSTFLHEYSKQNDLNFIRFDNFGHGKSSGLFIQQTIGSWKEGFEYVLDNLVIGDFILVGSSMGGWISMLVAEKYKPRLKGLVLISPAPDFTEVIWQKLSQDERKEVEKKGVIEFGPESCKYPISYHLIREARKYLLLDKPIIQYNCPVSILYGKQDNEVPYSTIIKMLNIIQAPEINLKILQDSKHNLSSSQDLKAIVNILQAFI